MKLVATVLLASMFLTFPLPPTSAHHSWLISAGKDWGPIYLDMTEQNALNVLGPPQSRADSSEVNPAYIHTLYYHEAGLWFDNKGTQGYLLSLIELIDSTSVTREGIRVGSALGSVMRTYGDIGDNAKVRGTSAVQCLRVSLFADRRGARAGQPSYDSPQLHLDYLDRGIGFDFTPIGGGTPRVVSINVSQPTECRPGAF